MRGATLVSIQNLRVGGAFSGLLVTDAAFDSWRLVNCLLQGNGAQGLVLEHAWLVAEATTFD
jgi:hypothetical protein